MITRIKHALGLAGIVACSTILVLTPALAASAPANQQEPSPASLSPLADGVTTTIVHEGTVQLQVLSQGNGPSVMILPSLGRSVRDYDKVAGLLAAKGFRVIRPEPRGIGESTGPMDNLTMHDYANDAAAVIRDLHAGSAVIVGHAWGNFAARQLAVDHPDLVKGVVLAAASAGKVPPGSKEVPISSEMRKAIDGAGDLSLSPARRLIYLKEAFFAPGNDQRAWVDGWYVAAHDAESHARDVTPVDSYFAAGSAPILDLQAADDAVAPRRFSKVLKRMVGDRVTIEVVPHAGHALAPEQPAAMANAIAVFAQRLNGGAPSNTQ